MQEAIRQPTGRFNLLLQVRWAFQQLQKVLLDQLLRVPPPRLARILTVNMQFSNLRSFLGLFFADKDRIIVGLKLPHCISLCIGNDLGCAQVPSNSLQVQDLALRLLHSVLYLGAPSSFALTTSLTSSIPITHLDSLIQGRGAIFLRSQYSCSIDDGEFNWKSGEEGEKGRGKVPRGALAKGASIRMITC
eukprot:Gb_29024 [translate_table: standard]